MQKDLVEKEKLIIQLQNKNEQLGEENKRKKEEWDQRVNNT